MNINLYIRDKLEPAIEADFNMMASWYETLGHFRRETSNNFSSLIQLINTNQITMSDNLKLVLQRLEETNTALLQMKNENARITLENAKIIQTLKDENTDLQTKLDENETQTKDALDKMDKIKQLFEKPEEKLQSDNAQTVEKQYFR